PKSHPGVRFVELDELLGASHVVSLHLLLTDETRGIISRERIARMRDGAILINTARGALVDEDAMIEALQSGKLGHAGLDVFVTKPMPQDHPLTRLDNVTLSAHSAFRTPEASDNLIQAALNHCRRISGQGEQQCAPSPAWTRIRAARARSSITARCTWPAIPPMTAVPTRPARRARCWPRSTKC